MEEWNIRFRRILTERVSNYSEFARLIGVTWKTLDRWMRGVNQPRIVDAMHVAAALDVSLDELFLPPSLKAELRADLLRRRREGETGLRTVKRGLESARKDNNLEEPSPPEEQLLSEVRQIVDDAFQEPKKQRNPSRRDAAG